MKANFIIIKTLINIGLIVVIAIDYTTGNIKGYGEKGKERMDLLKIIKHYRTQKPNKEIS